MVTLSSTEAETYAAVEATKDIVYFRAILEELGFPQLQPTPLYVDNKSLITVANNSRATTSDANTFSPLSTT